MLLLSISLNLLRVSKEFLNLFTKVFLNTSLPNGLQLVSNRFALKFKVREILSPLGE